MCNNYEFQDGFTSLAILPPVGDGIIPGTEKDRPISLGHLIGNKIFFFKWHLFIFETLLV